nr:MAG TPA: hypothetical protein [Caudoviricetes sp.]
MSAYVCNDETISLLVDGFMNYETALKSEGYEPKIQIIYNVETMKREIGQELLNKNYDSVNFRYRENRAPREFRYIENNQRNEEYKYSTENLYNAIGEYEYQTCELNDYYESKLHFSMLRLKDDMLKRYIKREKVKDCEVNFNL